MIFPFFDERTGPRDDLLAKRNKVAKPGHSIKCGWRFYLLIQFE
jgi:hypothetical protein